MNTVLSLLSLFWVCLETPPAASTSLPLADSLHVSISHRGTCYLYKKIKHRLEIKAVGVVPEDLELTCSKGYIKRGEGNSFSVYHPGPGQVLLTIYDRKTGRTARHLHTIRGIRNPMLTVGEQRAEDAFSAETFKLQRSLDALISYMGRDLNCAVLRYSVLRETKGAKPKEVTNESHRFLEPVLTMTQQAKTGDRYVFRNVHVRCPGDAVGRVVNELAFTIR